MYNNMHSVMFILICTVSGQLSIPRFSNPIYPEYGYNGSRVLETNYTRNKYIDFNWTQIATVAGNGDVWMVDTSENVVVHIPSNSTDANYPARGTVYAGINGRAGYYDGSGDVSLFNKPKGIAILSNTAVNLLIIADTGNHCIRSVDLETGFVSTYAGICGQGGKRDGDGRKALFESPVSLGVDSRLGMVAVLDNSGSIRVVQRNEKNGSVQVGTLVQGACRVVSSVTSYITIKSRLVRCQTEGWWVTSPGSNEYVEQWVWPTYCLGNSVTCTNRYDDTFT
jgi:hypothetical protein